MRKVHAVGVLIENPKGEILVIYRHKNESEGMTWGPVGGEIDSGETKEEALVRELKEEINFDADEKDFEFLQTFNLEYKDKVVKFELFKMVLTRQLSDMKLQETEATGYMWEKPETLYKRQDLILGLYQILEKIYKLS